MKGRRKGPRAQATRGVNLTRFVLCPECLMGRATSQALWNGQAFPHCSEAACFDAIMNRIEGEGKIDHGLAAV